MVIAEIEDVLATLTMDLAYLRGVWAEPSATNKVGVAGWLPDRDYDTGEIGWSKAEATRRCREHKASIMRAHWTYSGASCATDRARGRVHHETAASER